MNFRYARFIVTIMMESQAESPESTDIKAALSEVYNDNLLWDVELDDEGTATR